MAECSLPVAVPKFAILDHLGDGGYGSVYLVHHRRWGIVAHKICVCPSTDSCSSTQMKELKEEAERHSKLCDPNIVILFDAVFESAICGLFLEYMKYGAVNKFLKQFEVSFELRMHMMNEVASAMSYLHTQNPAIIHGDLSCQNILIGDGFHAKVADFGLARILKDDYSRSETFTPLRGKERYIAPEYFKNPRKRKTKPFDIYGFAISSWEILSGKDAYHDYCDRILVMVSVGKGDRPKIEDLDSAIPKSIKKTIQDCWHRNENKRPDFERIEDRISEHISTVKNLLKRSLSSLIEQEQRRKSRSTSDWEITKTQLDPVETNDQIENISAAINMMGM